MINQQNRTNNESTTLKDGMCDKTIHVHRKGK